jgi:hypothetical protein
MDDGTFCLVFNFMPPSDVEDREEAFFDQFDQELQRALGVPVVWEDRERFVIPSPKEDTIERVTAFIKTCRRISRAVGPQKKRGVRSAFDDAVGEALAPTGFRFRKKEEGYVRRIPAGRQILYALVDEYRPLYHFSFFLSIELNAVCAIVKEFGASGKTITHLEYFGFEPVGPWGAGFWVSVANAGATDEFLEPLRRKGFRIEPDELEEALRKATALIHDKLLPFLDRYQDVASIDQALQGTAARDVRAKGWWRRIVGKYLKRKEEEAPDA